MARGGGFALKTIQWFLRAVEFLCAALILGIFSYFLATLNNHGMSIANWIRAVEGISGAAALYTLCGLALLCCLAGHAFFSLLAIILDVLFAGAFIYVAIQTRFGANSCTGYVVTPIGSGDANTGNTVPAPNQGGTVLPSFKLACQLETACFAVSIVAMYVSLPQTSFPYTNIPQRLLLPLRPHRDVHLASPQKGAGIRPLPSKQLHRRLQPRPPPPLLATTPPHQA